MFPEAARSLKAAAPLFSQAVFLGDLRILSVTHGGSGRLQAHRHFSISRRATAKIQPPPRPRERVEIPGLQKVTYAEKMHYVPELSKPVNPHWERDYKDPRFYTSPPAHEMVLNKDKPCYMFHQRTNILKGVTQALWLTKTQPISGLPPQLLSLGQDPANHIPDQDERVQNAIKHARFWDTKEQRPNKERYSKTLMDNLLHLCATLQSSHPAVGRRSPIDKYSLAATWKRGENRLQIRGTNGLLHTCMDPLPAASGKQDIADTAGHVLETFYPVSPIIDLQKVHVYHEEMNSTGFKEDYAYPHAHTLYFHDGQDPGCRLQPDQFKAKMIMFAFGNALARAHLLYGTQPQSVLDHPVTVQAVGTNGRLFHFMVFQLNSTDLSGDDGIKNQVWVDQDAELYKYAKVTPKIKKKQVVVPAGLEGYNPETFSKFLALYLNGAV